MALISVKEYSKLFIGDFDAQRPSVTPEQADVLTNLKPVYGFEVFKHVNRHALATQQYAGVIQLGQHTLEVLPKIDGPEQLVRRNLIVMLATVFDLDISDGEAARVARQSEDILEILIRIFCERLFVQIHRGLVRNYEGREENLSVLRGKLAVTEQIRRNAGNPERLFCRYDDFTEDGPLNQIFKAAIKLLLRLSRSSDNQRKLSELCLVFAEVSDISQHMLPWRKVKIDRTSARFAPCFKLAEMFLRKTLPDVTGGRGHGVSLFFDMNLLFEEYIGRIVKRVFSPQGYSVWLQGPRKYLAVEALSQQKVFAMKPDVLGAIAGRNKWIIDTKWKSLSEQKSKEGVSQADLYQMYAYAHSYDCADIVLLYPHHHELSGCAGVRNVYQLNSFGAATEDGGRNVYIATVDLADLVSVPKQLLEIVPNADFCCDAINAQGQI